MDTKLDYPIYPSAPMQDGVAYMQLSCAFFFFIFVLRLSSHPRLFRDSFQLSPCLALLLYVDSGGEQGRTRCDSPACLSNAWSLHPVRWAKPFFSFPPLYFILSPTSSLPRLIGISDAVAPRFQDFDTFP